MTSKLEMITLIVEDMSAPLAFYRQLGYEIPMDADTQDHVEVTSDNGFKFDALTAQPVRDFLYQIEQVQSD